MGSNIHYSYFHVSSPNKSGSQEGLLSCCEDLQVNNDIGFLEYFLQMTVDLIEAQWKVQLLISGSCHWYNLSTNLKRKTCYFNYFIFVIELNKINFYNL